MKKFIYLQVLLFSIISCSKNEPNPTNSDKIIGKWQFSEFFGGDGGNNPSWSEIPNGYTIEFLENGKFISNRFNECSIGTYSLSTNNELLLDYNCTDFQNNYKEKIMNLTNAELIIRPTDSQCDEGCDYKFKKIK